jgi:NAD(P)-dependent dehydrogenase (short-subunit alcohol dehydrogenase family)
MNELVVVVIGAGGIGEAIARRQGSGRSVLLADVNEGTLDAAATVLRAGGHSVTTQRVDVSSRESVSSLASAAATLGSVVQVAHTAGLAPAQASPAAILAVDLLGTALVLEELGRTVAIGGAGVVISSNAGYTMPRLEPSQDEALAHTPCEELLQLPFLGAEAIASSARAYAMSKHANHLRVQAASVVWGDRGARVNSISPGIISTPMAQAEMASEDGEMLRRMIEVSASARVGTTDEIASAAAYLLGADATFITGTDLLIDGGVIAALRAGRLQLSR